jgi:hypothetical protein
MARKAGMIFFLLLLVSGYFVGLDYLIITSYIESPESINSNQDNQMVIEFECKVWVEDVSTKTRQENLITVATFFQNMAPMGGVEGEVTVEFPDGQKALFYLPKTNSSGISTVSVDMSDESYDPGTGRVLVSVRLHSFDMVCDAETSFFVWY